MYAFIYIYKHTDFPKMQAVTKKPITFQQVEILEKNQIAK